MNLISIAQKIIINIYFFNLILLKTLSLFYLPPFWRTNSPKDLIKMK